MKNSNREPVPENSKSPDDNLPDATHLNGASLELPGEQEKLVSMHEASKMTGYHQDYLGQVARSGKLKARKMGRNWFTTKLAVDMFLGRVPDPEKIAAVGVTEVDEPIASVMETVLTPIANFQPAMPVTAQVSAQVPQPQKVSAVQINIVRPEPVAQEIFAEAEAPVLALQAQRSRKVTVNILSVSPDAGPNLQEAIAIPQPERLTLPPNLGLDNKNKYHRLSKLFASRRVSRTRVQPAGNFFPATAPARMFPVPALVGLAALLVTIAAGSAYYFSGALAEKPQAQVEEQVAGASTSAVGRGQVLAGDSQAIIFNDSIDPSSVVLVSLRSDQPGRHWVTGQSEGRFMLMLTEPAAEDLHFDYWVAAEAPAGGGGPQE